MRRKELTWNNQKEVIEFLKEKKTGTLSLWTGQQLLCFPMNYYFDGKNFIFHGSSAAFKMEAVSNNCKATFCVYEELSLIASGWMGNGPCSASQFYRSVVAEGCLEELKGTEKKTAFTAFMHDYEPETEHDWESVPVVMMDATAVFRLKTEKLIGKHKIGQHLNAQNRALLKQKLEERGNAADQKVLGLKGFYGSDQSGD